MDPATPTEYKLTEAFFRKLVAKSLVVAPLCMLAVAAGVLAVGDIDTSTLMVIGFAVGVLIPFSIFRTQRQQRESFRSLRIIIRDNAITRVQDGLPRMEIPFAQIVRIEDVPGKWLIVHGQTPTQSLALPATLERFDELRERLGRVRPFESAKYSSIRHYAVLLLAAVVTLACMITFYRSHSRVVVIGAGILLILLLVGCGVFIARNPHVDRRIKRGLWVLAIVIASIAASIITVAMR